MIHHLAVAVRALDPPGGGAERSLSTLLRGISVQGLGFDSSAKFSPLSPSPDLSSQLMQPWKVSTLYSRDGGEQTNLLTEDISVSRIELTSESFFSGLAWRLRSRRTGHPNSFFLKKHFQRINLEFYNKVSSWLDTFEILPTLGLTQLEWSAGAAQAFRERNIPYLLFVRDDIPSRFPSIFRQAIEEAICVCTAGEGLGAQIASQFSMKMNVNIPLPIDYSSRFKSIENIEKIRKNGLQKREENNSLSSPHFTIIGVTPEKGLRTYHRLFPFLLRKWPEAHFHIYGSGSYVEQLGRYSNTTLHGHVSVEHAFAETDVHVLIVETTGSWGRVINEAGLFSIPTVTCSIGSQPEAVGNGGIVIENHHDLPLFEQALRNCWKQRDQLGKLAFSHSGITDHRRTVSIFRSLLEDIVSET
jgi:glycosyltransferase involved in cell wall biosynthesis